MNRERRKAIKAALAPLQGFNLDFGADDDATPDLGLAKSILTDAITALTEVKDEEQDTFDNLPEGLQQAERGQQMESNVAEMESAIEELENVDMDDNEDWRDELHDAIESAASQLEAL